MHSPECNLVLTPSNVLCTLRTFLDQWRTFLRGFFVTYRTLFRCTPGLEDRSWLILSAFQERSWVSFLHSQECSWMILSASTDQSSGASCTPKNVLEVHPCTLKSDLGCAWLHLRNVLQGYLAFWRTFFMCTLAQLRVLLVALNYISWTFFSCTLATWRTFIPAGIGCQEIWERVGDHDHGSIPRW